MDFVTFGKYPCSMKWLQMMRFLLMQMTKATKFSYPLIIVSTNQRVQKPQIAPKSSFLFKASTDPNEVLLQALPFLSVSVLNGCKLLPPQRLEHLETYPFSPPHDHFQPSIPLQFFEHKAFQNSAHSSHCLYLWTLSCSLFRTIPILDRHIRAALGDASNPICSLQHWCLFFFFFFFFLSSPTQSRFCA